MSLVEIKWVNDIINYYIILYFCVVNFVELMGLNFWLKDYKFDDLEGFMNIINIYLVY